MITRLKCPSSANNMSANKQMLNFDLKFKQKYARMMQRQIKSKQKAQNSVNKVKSQRYLMQHLFQSKVDKKQESKQKTNSLSKSKLIQASVCRSKSKQALNNYLRWSKQKRSVLSLDIDQYKTNNRQSRHSNRYNTSRHSNRYKNAQSFRYKATDQDINQLHNLNRQISSISNKGTPKSVNKQFSDRKLNNNQSNISKIYLKNQHTPRSQSSKCKNGKKKNKDDINLNINTQTLDNKNKQIISKNRYQPNAQQNIDNYLLEYSLNTNNNNQTNVKNKYYANQLKYQRALQLKSREQLKINNSISTILADARKQKIQCQLLNQLRYRQRARSCNQDNQSYRMYKKPSRLHDKFSILSGKIKSQSSIQNNNFELIKKIKTKYNNSKNKFQTQFGNLLDLIHRKSEKKPQLSRNQLLISRKDQKNYRKYDEKYQDHGSNALKRYYQKQSKRHGSVEQLSGMEYCLLSTKRKFGQKKNSMESKIVREQRQINKIKQSLTSKKQKIICERERSNQKSPGLMDYDQYILILDKSRCKYNKRKQIVLNFGNLKKQNKTIDHKPNLFDTKHSYSPWNNKDRGNSQQVQEMDSQNQEA